MIEPQVEHGGASSWFCIAANFEPRCAGAEATEAGPEDAEAAVAFTSSTSCSGVVGVSGTLTPASYCFSSDRNFAASHRKM